MLPQKAFILFTAQDNRCFVPVLSFYSHNFRLTLYDRSGVVHTKTYSLNTHQILLLHIIAGLMFGREEVIGYDVTMRTGADGQVIGIEVGGKEYAVIRRLFAAQTLRGRATKCWRVHLDSKYYVIKDSWIHTGRGSNELATLKVINNKGLEGTPTLIAGEDLKLFDGTVDSTELHRPGQRYGKIRCHRQMVMTPVAEPLGTFRSKKELIGVFVDFTRSTSFYFSLSAIFIVQFSPYAFM